MSSEQGVERCEAIRGETRDESVSLFDGWCVRRRLLRNDAHESVWVDGWRAESWGTWIEPHDMASCIEIEFDVAASTGGTGALLHARLCGECVPHSGDGFGIGTKYIDYSCVKCLPSRVCAAVI